MYNFHFVVVCVFASKKSPGVKAFIVKKKTKKKTLC